jgi:hypothetical protein
MSENYVKKFVYKHKLQTWRLFSDYTRQIQCGQCLYLGKELLSHVKIKQNNNMCVNASNDKEILSQ